MKSHIKSGKRGLFNKIFWGVLFILLAAGLIATAIGAQWNIDMLWIISGVVLGLIAIKSLVQLEWFGVFIPIALWVTIAQGLVRNWLGIEDLRIWAVWLAAVALSIGLSIFIRKRRCSGGSNDNCTMFAATTKRFKAEDAKFVRIDTRFGGEKVYIEQGQLPKNAVLDLDVSFAGVELFIPGTWQIIDNVDKSFGGITEKNVPAAGEPDQTITLTGSVSFGGVEIIYT